MAKTIRSRENFDECSEIHNFSDCSVVNRSLLCFLGEFTNDFNRPQGRRLIRGRDEDGSIVLNIYICSSLFDNASNHLSTRPNDIPHTVLGNLHRHDSGRVGRNIFAWLGNHLVHLIQDMHPSVVGLRQSLSYETQLQPFDLDIHLQGGNAMTRAADFEVHISQMIFKTEDVG